MERTQTVVIVTYAKRQSVQVSSPAPVGVWNSLLANDSEALAFQTPAWVKALIATGAYRDASRLYEFENGRRLLLPLVQQAGVPEHLASAGSMPNSWGMGGLVSPNGKLHADEASAVFEDLRRLTVLRASIRPNPCLRAPGNRPAHPMCLPNRCWRMCWTSLAGLTRFGPIALPEKPAPLYAKQSALGWK